MMHATRLASALLLILECSLAEKMFLEIGLSEDEFFWSRGLADESISMFVPTNPPVTSVPPSTPAPVVPPTTPPVAPQTTAPVAPQTPPPVVLPTAAPVAPQTPPPVVLPTAAPVVTPTTAPVVPQTPPPTAAPVAPQTPPSVAPQMPPPTVASVAPQGCSLTVTIACNVGEGIECDRFIPDASCGLITQEFVYTFSNVGTTAFSIDSYEVTRTNQTTATVPFDRSLTPGGTVTAVDNFTFDSCVPSVTTVTAVGNPGNCEGSDTLSYTATPRRLTTYTRGGKN